MSSPKPALSDSRGAVSDTRGELLKTAWSLIEKRGVAQVTLAHIAAEAGVSRQAVYLHFGSRAGLLTEMVRHRDATSLTVRKMLKAMQDPDPQAAVEQFVRLWFRHVRDILPVARAIEASAATDEAAGAAWRDRMEALRQAIAGMVDRLAASGQLAKGWTTQQATDWFWSRTHMDVWSQLAVDRGWDAEVLVNQVIQSLWSDLTRGPEASGLEPGPRAAKHHR